MTNLVPFSLILGVAAAFILLGGGLFIGTFRFRAKAQHVVARLVKSEEYGSFREDGRLAVRLTYEYTTPDGRNIRADRKSLRWNIPPKGSRRAMLVDPKNPLCLQLPGNREYLVPLVLVLIGIFILFMFVLRF